MKSKLSVVLMTALVMADNCGFSQSAELVQTPDATLALFRGLSQQYNQNDQRVDPGDTQRYLQLAQAAGDATVSGLVRQRNAISDLGRLAYEKAEDLRAAEASKISGFASLLGRTSGVITNADGSTPSPEDWDKYKWKMRQGALVDVQKVRLELLEAKDKMNQATDRLRQDLWTFAQSVYQSAPQCSVPISANVVQYRYGVAVRVRNESQTTLRNVVVMTKTTPDLDEINQATLGQGAAMFGLFRWGGLDLSTSYDLADEGMKMIEWLKYSNGSMAFIPTLAPNDVVDVYVCYPPQLEHISRVEAALYSDAGKGILSLAPNITSNVYRQAQPTPTRYTQRSARSSSTSSRQSNASPVQRQGTRPTPYVYNPRRSR